VNNLIFETHHRDCEVYDGHFDAQFGKVVWVRQFGGDVKPEFRVERDVLVPEFQEHLRPFFESLFQ